VGEVSSSLTPDFFLTHSQTSRRTPRNTLTAHAHACKENVKSAQKACIDPRIVLHYTYTSKGVSPMVIGSLKSSPGKAYLTFNDAKRQIRAMAKKGKLKPVGTFRPRRLNRGELSLPIEGGHLVATRKPGAEVRVMLTKNTTAADLTSEQLIAVMADAPSLTPKALSSADLAAVAAVDARIRELSS
jgi:hypothetical protein